MSITATERALVDLCAGLLELVKDETLFRGRLPASRMNAVAVIIDSPGRGNNPAMVRYAVQLLGRFESRDSALEMCDKFDQLFPHVGDGFYILKTGRPAVYDTKVKGREAFGVSVNLDVRLTQ